MLGAKLDGVKVLTSQPNPNAAMRKRTNVASNEDGHSFRSEEVSQAGVDNSHSNKPAVDFKPPMAKSAVRERMESFGSEYTSFNTDRDEFFRRRGSRIMDPENPMQACSISETGWRWKLRTFVRHRYVCVGS